MEITLQIKRDNFKCDPSCMFLGDGHLATRDKLCILFNDWLSLYYKEGKVVAYATCERCDRLRDVLRGV